MRILVALFLAAFAVTGAHSQDLFFTNDGEDWSGEDILALFEAEDFEKLEYIAADLRKSKARYSGGAWALHFFYEYAPENARALEGDAEQSFVDKIERWKEAYPESVCWRIILAHTYELIAWQHRGGGFANTVSEDQWRTFREYSLKAWKAIVEAEELPTIDPEIYPIAYELVLDLGEIAGENLRRQGKTTFGFAEGDTPDTLQRRIFDAGIAVEPLYYDLYYKRARSLELRWGGKRGELEDFLLDSVEKTKHLIGEAIYARLFWFVKWNLGSARTMSYYDWDWEHIELGHEDTILQLPDSEFWPPHFCYAACLFEKREKAQELFALSPAYYANVWKDKRAFTRWHTWAFRDADFPFGGPISAALQDQNSEYLTHLLENGEDPERRNERGFSMLYLAMYYRNWEHAEILLEAGAKLFRSECASQTVVNFSEEILQFLIDVDFDLQSTNEAKWTLLHYASSFGAAPMIRRLVKEGLDLDAVAAGGNTPLILAARRGDQDCVQALVSLGADITIKAGGGSTAEEIARRKNFPEIVRILSDTTER